MVLTITNMDYFQRKTSRTVTPLGLDEGRGTMTVEFCEGGSLVGGTVWSDIKLANVVFIPIENVPTPGEIRKDWGESQRRLRESGGRNWQWREHGRWGWRYWSCLAYKYGNWFSDYKSKVRTLYTNEGLGTSMGLEKEDCASKLWGLHVYWQLIGPHPIWPPVFEVSEILIVCRTVGSSPVWEKIQIWPV